MLDLNRARLEREGLRAHLLLQVHDELVLEVHRDDSAALAQAVEEEMSQAFALRVPLKVDVGRGANWLEAH